MPEWLAVLCMIITWAMGAWLGYRIGHRRGSALCPNDFVLRDVARQRDQLMRERDIAFALANQFSMELAEIEGRQQQDLN